MQYHTYSVVAPNNDLILVVNGVRDHSQVLVEAETPVEAAIIAVQLPELDYRVDGGYQAFNVWVYNVIVLDGDKRLGELIVIQHKDIIKHRLTDEEFAQEPLIHITSDD